MVSISLALGPWIRQSTIHLIHNEARPILLCGELNIGMLYKYMFLFSFLQCGRQMMNVPGTIGTNRIKY